MSTIWESANWTRQFGIRQTGNRQFGMLPLQTIKIQVTEFVTTQKGGKLLLYEGLKYTVNRNGKDNKVYWCCHIRKCPGRAVSDRERFVSSTTHDHDTDGAFTTEMHDSNPRYEMQGLQHSPRRDS